MHGRDVIWALANLVDRPGLLVELNSVGFQKAEMLVCCKEQSRIGPQWKHKGLDNIVLLFNSHLTVKKRRS